MEALIGRREEQEILRRAVTSREAELVAVYGRRRVGKTFLIRRFFGKNICFELVGIRDGLLSEQLAGFAQALNRRQPVKQAGQPPSSWMEAFDQLTDFLDRRLKRRKRKQVIFFDELPWLASRRGRFLPAFEHFWNSWASAQSNLIVVICGSAASWMLRNVIRHRGGLHNRVTRRLLLLPLSLRETEQFLHKRKLQLSRYQTLELYMALGGVPYYLKQVLPGQSAAQAIDAACFSRNGALREEFKLLYQALFDKAERHERVVRALAQKRRGLRRGEIIDAIGLQSNSSVTKLLGELEESGFVTRVVELGKSRKNASYWLADEYSRFYLRWIEKHRGQSRGAWMRKRRSPSWRAWSGNSFEGICLKHVEGIKQALGIAGVETFQAGWRHQPTVEVPDGAQIDLVIDRTDMSINLCEVKFSEAPFVISKRYAEQLRHKRATFQRVTKTRKSLFLTLVSTFGVADNAYARELGVQSIAMDALFSEPHQP